MRPGSPQSVARRAGAAGALVALLALIGCGSTPREMPTPPRTGDYLGEGLPGDSPALFAPGLISTGNRQRDTAISADGDRFLYTLWGLGRGTIIEVVRRNGRWSDPEVASFSGTFSDLEPFFDPRGGRLVFSSQRPLPGETEAGDWNLWSVELTSSGWGSPWPIEGVNQDGDEFYPAIGSTGAIYFTAERAGGVGGEDIFRAAWANGVYGAATPLGSGVNSPEGEFNAYVAPDERLIIFSSARADGLGGGDLYLSRRGDDGRWLPARSLGPRINSPALDYCPFVSPDGRVLFFSSFRASAGLPGRLSYRDLLAALDGPRNGQGSLYWVSASVLE